MVDPKYDDVDVNWFHIVGGELAFKYKIMPEFSSGVMMTKVDWFIFDLVSAFIKIAFFQVT